MEPSFFPTQKAFAKWLKANHAEATECWIGFYKKGSGKTGITYQEALDEALCFGWIDGIRKSHDEEAFKIRFSPRKPRSLWSEINIRRVKELEELGLMTDVGMEVFNARKAQVGYRIKTAPKELPEDLKKIFVRNKKAWAFHEKQPPGYRKLCAFWISFAKREETRMKRLQYIIDLAEQGNRIPRW